MALELTDYEKHYLLTNPDALLILMDMHDMQQDQADSMEAGCHGNELRHEELRQHGAKLIEADPGIWSAEIQRRFAEPTGHAAKRLAQAREAVAASGVAAVHGQTKPPADADGGK